MYGMYAYIDPQNHPNVGIYGSPISCVWLIQIALSQVCPRRKNTVYKLLAVSGCFSGSQKNPRTEPSAIISWNKLEHAY